MLVALQCIHTWASKASHDKAMEWSRPGFYGMLASVLTLHMRITITFIGSMKASSASSSLALDRGGDETLLGEVLPCDEWKMCDSDTHNGYT
jgi:hypothetical protein